MLVGYMRVSSDNDRQTTILQRDALIAAGVDTRHLFEDKASGARDNRPGLKGCLDYVKAGDTLSVAISALRAAHSSILLLGPVGLGGARPAIIPDGH